MIKTTLKSVYMDMNWPRMTKSSEIWPARSKELPAPGLHIHTKKFCTQNCNKKILIILRLGFQ